MNSTAQHQSDTRKVDLNTRQVALIRRSLFVLKRSIEKDKQDPETVAELNRLDSLLVQVSAKG